MKDNFKTKSQKAADDQFDNSRNPRPPSQNAKDAETRTPRTAAKGSDERMSTPASREQTQQE